MIFPLDTIEWLCIIGLIYDQKVVIYLESIKRFREKSGLTRKELADRLHIHEETLGRYERGDREPSGSIIKSMADLFGCSTDDLLNPPASSKSTRTSA